MTLDTLSELIQNPKGGGHATTYRLYRGDVNSEYGSKGTTAHWVLMTRDVVPNSRDKSFKDQCALVKGSDEPPHLLDATVGILMDHAMSGERLFSDSPFSYTRCQEKVNDYQTCVGGLSSGGLSLHLWHDSDIVGLGFLRKL